MQRSSLFLLLVLLAVSPLAATATETIIYSSAAFVQCVGDGLYTANSTYEANLRRLAAVCPAEASSRYAYRSIGYWPNRLRAASNCFTGNSSACTACVASAFQQAERACPYVKKVIVFSQDCTLRFADFTAFFKGNAVFEVLEKYSIMDLPISNNALRILHGPSIIEILAPVIVLQAIGFGWLFFLLLQEWRDKKSGSIMRDSSLPSGDQ